MNDNHQGPPLDDTGRPHPGSAVRILVADDEPDIRTAVKAILRRSDIPEVEVITCASAEEGLRIIDATAFDLVISDHRMGRMSGVDFLEEVRRRSPRTARIMITGFNEEAIALDAINKAHVHGYILKPWRTREFLELIERVLDERAAAIHREAERARRVVNSLRSAKA